MSNHTAPRPEARFAVSLHPEVFYALQVLSDPKARVHPRWKARASTRFPARRRPLALPGALWTAVPDVLDLDPTTDFSAILAAFEKVPARQLQEGILAGMLHHRSAVMGLLDRGLPLPEVVAALPRAKREWLAHVGLYPIEPRLAAAFDRLIRSPETFRSAVVETVRGFWDAVFRETWDELVPALQASVSEKEKLYDTSSFREFLRHTLLPVELDEKRRVLRALRGGYELPLADVGRCTFTPSVFNDSRFWTASPDRVPCEPWFPYFEPSLRPHHDRHEGNLAEPAPDIALIFRALGDTTRFAMASLLAREPRSAVELAAALSVSKPTISHHLHLLRSSNLIHETDHGGSTLISLRKDTLLRLSDLAVDRLFESRKPLALSRSRTQK